MSFNQEEWNASLQRYQRDHRPLTVCEFLTDQTTSVPNFAACFLLPSYDKDEDYQYGNHYLSCDGKVPDPFRITYKSSGRATLVLREGVTSEPDLLTFYHIISDRDGSEEAREMTIKLLEEIKSTVGDSGEKKFRTYLIGNARLIGITSKADEPTEWYYGKIMSYLKYVL